MPYLHHVDDHGDIFTANGETVHLPRESDVFAGLLQPMRQFTETATQTEALVRPEMLADQLATNAARPLLSATRIAIDVAARFEREAREADARAMQVPPSVDMSNAGEIRGIYRALKVPEQLRRIGNAPLVELAALVQPGNLAALSSEGLELATDRYLVAAHIERAGLSGSYPRTPSLDRIVAIGVDHDAAFAAGKAVYDAHRQRLDQAEMHEGVLQHQLRYISAALSLHPTQAFERVMAA